MTNDKIQSIYEKQVDNFNFCNKTWNGDSIICEDEHSKIIVFTETKTIEMFLIWEKPHYYDGTDTVNYCVRAYKGGGLFATTNYEDNIYLIHTSLPDKNDY